MPKPVKLKTPKRSTLKRHGISAKDWSAALDRQAGKCSTCGKLMTTWTITNGQLECRLHPATRGHQAKSAIAYQEKMKLGKATCSRCRKKKKFEDFPYGTKGRCGRTRYRYCKKCHRVAQRERKLKVIFNITEDDYKKMVDYQGGTCFVCGRPPKKNRLNIDHDHKSGLIRGLLCSWCNKASGMFKDDASRLEKLIAFYADPPAPKALGSPKYGCIGSSTNRASVRKRLNQRSATASFDPGLRSAGRGR